MPENQRIKIREAISKKIAQIDLKTGLVVRVWSRAMEASSETGLSLCTIREACMGYYWDSRAKKRRERDGNYSGFLWRFATQNEADTIKSNVPVDIIVEKRRKKVLQIDVSTNEIVDVWESIQAIVRVLGFRSNGVSIAIKEKKVCREYYWKSADNNEQVTTLGFEGKHHPKRKNIKPVAQIDMTTGHVICNWRSASEASRQLGISETSISNTCNGRYYDGKTKRFYPKESHAGFKWQYLE